MDLALTINAWIDEEIMFAQQLGSRQVFVAVDARWSDAPGWDARALAMLANRVRQAGLSLAGLHAVRAPRGEAGEWIAGLARDAAAAGIGLLSLSGALLPGDKASRLELAGAPAPEGLRLAWPAARLLRANQSPAGLPQGIWLDAAPELCQEWLNRPDAGARRDALERVALVSFDPPRKPGTLPGTRLDALLPLCWRLGRAGYAGLLRLGRLAVWKGDTRESHHMRAFSTGYLRGVLQTFESGGN